MEEEKWKRDRMAPRNSTAQNLRGGGRGVLGLADAVELLDKRNVALARVKALMLQGTATRLEFARAKLHEQRELLNDLLASVAVTDSERGSI